LDGNFEFTRNQNETWAEAFVKEPRRIGIPEDRGFEAICYGTNGVDLYLMKEGLNSPILFYKGTVNNSITNVSSVAVTPKLASINKTNTLQLAATIAPSDATNPKVIWSSSDPTIATVDSKGLVTAVATGTTKITATTEDGAKTDYSDITVLNPTTLLILQAEDAVLSGAVAAAAQSNWNGTGYADFINNTGDFIKWTVTVPTDGNYELSFRYALGNTARPLELKVNGVVAVASLAFPSTTLWSTWRNVVSIQPLKAGINEIRLTTIGSNGGNIDELQVTNAANLGINQLESLQKKTVNLYPNPYQEGKLTVVLTGFEAQNEIKIKVQNLIGQTIYQTTIQQSNQAVLDLSGKLNEAIYFVCIESGNNQIVKKLMVN